jgi:hypothetical protein
VAKARPQTLSWLPWWLKGRLGRWLMRSALLVVLVALFLAGVIWLGGWAQTQIHDQPRYQVSLADIDCDVPEGMERKAFIDEVQYHSRLPDRVNVLDDDLPEQLGAAFIRHPWVDKVENVHVTPPRHVTVRLRFRTPVLAVQWDGELRAVDGAGILLPKNASTRGLPIYDGVPQRPRGPAGTHWGDTDLERAARRAQIQD